MIFWLGKGFEVGLAVERDLVCARLERAASIVSVISIRWLAVKRRIVRRKARVACTRRG